MGQKHKARVRGGRVARWASALVAVLMVGSVSYLGLRFFDFSKAATPGMLYVSPASGTFVSGSTISFTVREESGATPVNGVQFDLNYNGSQLQYLSNSNGEFTGASQTNTATSGLVRVFRGSDTGMTGDHAVVTFNFKMLATTGSTAVTFTQANSFMTNANDSTNALQAVQGATFSVAGGASGGALLTIAPADGNLVPGSKVTVAVKVDTSRRAYVIQSVVNYPSNVLQFQSFQNSQAFPSATRSSSATVGTLDFVRGVAGGGPGFVGQADVIKFTFKVIGSSGTANITIKRVGSGSNSSVLDGGAKNLLASSTDASFSISSGAAPPPVPVPGPPPTPTPSPSPLPSPTPVPQPSAMPVSTQNVTFTPQTSSGGMVALSNEGAVIEGTVDLAPIADLGILADNPDDVIVKVEYLLGGKVLSTKKAPPFTYNLDTRTLRNGKYEMTIRTTYKSGEVDLSKEAIVVNNKVTLAYVLRHYLPQIVVGAGSVATIGFVAVKYLLPRFGGGSSPYGYDYGKGYDGYDGYAAGAGGPEPPKPPTVGGGGYIRSFTNSYESPDPTVVAPSGQEQPSIPTFSADQKAAAQTTQPIDNGSLQYGQPQHPVQPIVPAANGQTGTTAQPAAQMMPQVPGSEPQPKVKYARKYF